MFCPLFMASPLCGMSAIVRFHCTIIGKLKKKEICPTCHVLSGPEEPFFNPHTPLNGHGR